MENIDFEKLYTEAVVHENNKKSITKEYFKDELILLLKNFDKYKLNEKINKLYNLIYTEIKNVNKKIGIILCQ